MARAAGATTPSYRKHKGTGQAVVTLNGHAVYLGLHGTAASRREYDRVIAEWLANGRQLPGDGEAVTVVELVASYLKHAESYYGKGSGEYYDIVNALKPVRRLYGQQPAARFGPLALRALQAHFAGTGIARSTVNGYVGRIKRMFRWATANERVPATVLHGLQAVEGLKLGRCDARESEPVRPVPDEHVEAIREHVAAEVWAMVELQRLTGMRSGEVTAIRGRDLNTTGELWEYRPPAHKNAWRGHDRVIMFGPRAREILRPFLRTDLDAYLFAPEEAEARRHAARRAARKSPVQPSQRRRRAASLRRRRRRAPGGRYDTDSYARAIRRGCEKGFPVPAALARLRGETPGQWRARLDPGQREELRAWRRTYYWHPHQLRHNFATRMRRAYGLEIARSLCGHKSVPVTQLYAEVDADRAARVMAEVG